MNPFKYNSITTGLSILIILLLCKGLDMNAQEFTKDRLHQYIDQMLEEPMVTTFYSNTNSNHQLTDQRSMVQAPQLPEVFCYESLGFFCKIEHKAMQRGNFPLRFRLGEFWSTVEAEYGPSY